MLGAIFKQNISSYISLQNELRRTLCLVEAETQKFLLSRDQYFGVTCLYDSWDGKKIPIDGNVGEENLYAKVISNGFEKPAFLIYPFSSTDDVCARLVFKRDTNGELQRITDPWEPSVNTNEHYSLKYMNNITLENYYVIEFSWINACGFSADYALLYINEKVTLSYFFGPFEYPRWDYGDEYIKYFIEAVIRADSLFD